MTSYVYVMKMLHGIFKGTANEPKMAQNYGMKTAPAVFVGIIEEPKMT